MTQTYTFPDPPPPPAKGSGKSGCLKWGLIGCGGVIALAILAIVAIGFFVARNGDGMVAGVERAEAEGAAAGAAADEAGCLRLAKARKTEGLTDLASTQNFTTECLRRARETPGFCDAVPAANEFRATVRWIQAQCPQGGQACSQAVQAMIGYCAAGRPKASADSAATAGPADSADWTAPADSA
ncbi:MAG TPA: hypothetical protein VHG91_05140 [Longimicrobium sp.]|nr:hypothetical protein [Longimicrobium sp.]